MEFPGVDLWAGLVDVREHLESTGRLVYRLRSNGDTLTDDDLVDIFAPAAPFEVVSVTAQRDAIRAFYAAAWGGRRRG